MGTKNILGLLLKLLVSGVILIYLFYYSGLVDAHKVISIVRQTRLSIFFFVFLLFLINVLITTKRWSLFLPDDMKYSRLVSLCFIGYFFSIFLPGRLGGDIVKTLYVFRDTGRGVSSIISVFLDRYMGISSIFVISFISFMGGYPYFRETKIELLVPGICGFFLFASLVLWTVNWGKIKGLNSFYAALMEYKTKKRLLAMGLLLSLVIQLTCIAGTYLISTAVGLTVPAIYFFIFVPIINAISAIPVTIAGLGVREAGFTALFGMFFTRLGVTPDQAVSISILTFAAMVLVNIIGGVEYVRIRKLPEEQGS
jgi:uncharacterized membrane protein YbhN (UPF0104 family)